MSFFYLFAANTPQPFDFATIFSSITTKYYFYIILFLFIAAVLIFTAIFKPAYVIKGGKTQTLAYAGVFVALSVIANTLSIGPDSFKLSLTFFVSFLSGYFFGPSVGFSIAFTGDLIAGIIAPQGVYNPLIGIASGLGGLIPGLLFGYGEKLPYLRIALSFLIVFLLSSVMLNTIATYYTYFLGSAKYTSLTAYLVVRLPVTTATAALNLTITLLLFKQLSRLKTALLKK